VRCSLRRPKWRTTGRVWVTHRRTLLGWITRTVSSAATQIGVGPKRPARSFRGSVSSPGADQRPATSATAGGSMGEISFKCPIGHQMDISLENWTSNLRSHSIIVATCHHQQLGATFENRHY
jgi:hypothetical protein